MQHLDGSSSKKEETYEQLEPHVADVTGRSLIFWQEGKVAERLRVVNPRL